MEKPCRLIAYKVPQATWLSGGASWSPPVVSACSPG